MTVCERCDKSGATIELIRESDGERIAVHGSCYLKSISGKAIEDDDPDKWAGDTHGLDEHYRRMREIDEVTTYG